MVHKHTHTHTHTHICLLFVFTIIYKSMLMLACLSSFISDPLTRPPHPQVKFDRPASIRSDGPGGPQSQMTLTQDRRNLG